MSRSIRGRHPNRRKKYSFHYREIDRETYHLARQPKPAFSDDGRRQSDERYFWERAHEKVFRGGGDGRHSDYHQAYMRWKARKQRRQKLKQQAYREIRDYCLTPPEDDL